MSDNINEIRANLDEEREAYADLSHAYQEREGEIEELSAEVNRLQKAIRESCEDNRYVYLAEPHRTGMCPIAGDLQEEIHRLERIERAAKELANWDDVHAEGEPFVSPDAAPPDGSTVMVSQCVECGQYWPCDITKLRRVLEIE